MKKVFQIRRKKKFVPLSALLKDECLGDIAKYAGSIYIDINTISEAKNKQVSVCK